MAGELPASAMPSLPYWAVLTPPVRARRCQIPYPTR
jgi:hypothetical protein